MTAFGLLLFFILFVSICLPSFSQSFYTCSSAPMLPPEAAHDVSIHVRTKRAWITSVWPREHILHGSRCGLTLRAFAFKGIVTAAASAASTITVMRPPSSMSQDLEKLLFTLDGYNYWMWQGRKMHYVVEGEGFSIVPIHGFGASAYDWRYNIPE